jgi:hypothetical protein
MLTNLSVFHAPHAQYELSGSHRGQMACFPQMSALSMKMYMALWDSLNSSKTNDTIAAI